MLVAQRQAQIAHVIHERGSVRVTELSTLFHVTEETIRRDLDALEQMGQVKRSHGGALRVDELQMETPYMQRETSFIAEKKAIALQAIQLIESGDHIVIDGSSTTYFLALTLPNMPLQVITNSLKVAAELANKKKISVVMTGGVLSPRSLSLVGPTAEQTLGKYHVNKAFISCKGVHPELGLSESNELQALVKQKMLSIADQAIVLADASKLGVQDFMNICSMAEIDHFITDDAADAGKIQMIKSLGVKVQLAQPER